MHRFHRDKLTETNFLITIFAGSPSTVPHSYEKGKMIDITRDKPIKVTVRVAVPVRDHPKVIFKSQF